MGVGVQGLGCSGVPQATLDGLHGFAVSDQERGVVVPQVMHAGSGRSAGDSGDRRPPDLAREGGAAERIEPLPT